MNREEKIAVIYKEMANTDTTIGCRVQIEWFGEMLKGTILDGTNILREDGAVEENCILRNVEIIGHPVMIGDVIDWIHPYGTGCAQDVRFTEERRRKVNLILLQWDKKRESIEAQSDECIDYIYYLIKS